MRFDRWIWYTNLALGANMMGHDGWRSVVGVVAILLSAAVLTGLDSERCRR